MSTHPTEMKNTSLVLNSSSRIMKSSITGMHRVNPSSQRFTGSQSRRCSILAGDSIFMDKSTSKVVRVLNDDGNDVTPLTLYHAESSDIQPKPGRYFLDEIFSSAGSDQLTSLSSFTGTSFGSFLGSSHSTKASLTKNTEDSGLKLDMKNIPPAPCVVQKKKDSMKQHVTEEMLDEEVHICLSETDTISLLDIPNTLVSEDVDNAEAIKQRNIDYAELCKNRMGNDKYVARSMWTFNGALKNKEIQSDKIVKVDVGAMATVWDIYDSFCEQNNTLENEKIPYPEGTVKTSRGLESSGSTFGTGSTISSLFEIQMCGTSLNAEPDPQQIMLSESFQHSLLVMERSIVAEVFQPKLAAYRQLPILADPDCMVKPATKEQGEEDEESSPIPTLEPLWAFSCELTRGRTITSMAWNKENLDLLAVGYGDFDSAYQKRGLICCWSLKNLTWPERVFRCHSSVTSLDFSANNPDRLAVGMYDGTVAIYSVQIRENKACVATSSKCSKKHLHPVWQVNWTRQEMRLSGEDRVESLVSVSADGRITKWFLHSNGLDCIDLMKLKRIQDGKKKAAGSKKKTDNVLSGTTPGLCVDFHPTDSSIYLAGTWEGLIHKCSFSNSQYFLDTYQTHFCPVNHVEWSPFSPDVFLSCSSDWTIQLWKQDHLTPVLGFGSTERAVYTVRWSPNWPTVFAAINGKQVEIWDMNSSISDPIIVRPAASGVKMTSLLFARGTDSILVGDNDGQVTFYELKNLSVGEEGKQVDCLEDIVHSAISR
ncbi:dynein axonemal intermediate chain 4-like isoform X1 [Thunnus albacares]|uniref:dynein axonemal intermediate chain 4-like isoform X1 n=1 Tax=Thunnus albacares TaxID=8236 RepID=UPI001CF61AED|nr:dynein axonemal intermediate chain 4-like isoform X1 [Thunnus albacares]